MSSARLEGDAVNRFDGLILALPDVILRGLNDLCQSFLDARVG